MTTFSTLEKPELFLTPAYSSFSDNHLFFLSTLLSRQLFAGHPSFSPPQSGKRVVVGVVIFSLLFCAGGFIIFVGPDVFFPKGEKR